MPISAFLPGDLAPDRSVAVPGVLHAHPHHSRQAQYRFTDRLNAFAAYDWSNEAYTLLDRPEDNDRFFMYDQRVSLGLQALLARHWTASLATGYLFDRDSFEGTSSSSSGFDRVNIGGGNLCLARAECPLLNPRTWRLARPPKTPPNALGVRLFRD